MRPLDERFDEKVRRAPDGCWVWLGATTRAGYGTIRRGGRADGWIYAHRYAYERVHGPIAAGLVIDHLCRNPSCVNPAHLEPVTQGENMRRGQHQSAVLRREGTCKNGHPRSDSYVHSDGRIAYCRRCRNERRRAQYRGAA